MMSWIEYDKETGFIRGTGGGTPGAVTPPNETDAFGIVLDAFYSGDDYYVDLAQSQIVPRPESTIEVSCDGRVVTFSQVPLRAKVTVSGDAIDSFYSEDAEVELTFAAPGMYTIAIESFPMKRFTRTITLT